MVIVAGRRRIGTIPALLLAGALFFVAFANGFTGGRDISSGSGRMVLWAMSIGLLKSHPLFGVGFGQLAEYIEHTAHNSIMVCAAETGLFGLFFWSMFLFSTLRDILTLASPEKVSEGEPNESANELPAYATRPRDLIEKPEIIRLGRLLILSFTGFLTAGFFLSRAFVLTFFLLGGIAETIYQMALQRGMVSPRLKLGRVMLYSAPLSIALVVGVYIFIRIGIFF
jgi:O-antigen ligase